MSTTDISLWMAFPFLILLLAIALFPLIAHRWWERAYPWVSICLGLATAFFYVGTLGRWTRLHHTALDYCSFIVLLGSLFVVTGGILIRIEGRVHPLINASILTLGALLSNLLGTTGASMLFIRTYLHLNRERLRSYLVVFYIFIVSNIGGALTPIGDPPLFLGYLKGIPFFWVMTRVWPVWLLTLGLTLLVFLVIDWRHHKSASLKHAATETKIVLKGWYNFLFLGVILGAVFQPTPYREAIMIVAAMASYGFTPRSLHHEHHFSFAPIKEVAILFFGIFATMMPALEWLEANANELGLSTAGSFYWATGVLSAFLDNAPTYLSFLSAALGLTGHDITGLLNQAPQYVIAISLGAVFFGAMTYIGNGPNFMVKSVADHRKAPCPTFLGYIFRYSCPILLPILALTWWVCLR